MAFDCYFLSLDQVEFRCSRSHDTYFISTQIQVKTGSTPALPPLQRTASNNTWRVACTAAKEKVPLGMSESPTLAIDPPTSHLALTRGSRCYPLCPVSVAAITAGG